MKMMISYYFVIQFIVAILIIIDPSNSQSNSSCTNYPSKIQLQKFTTCVKLPVLDSFLHYNYYPSNSTLEIAYRHTGINRATPMWVAWAINPTRTKMVGAQSIVAYLNHIDGSMVVYTSSITSYNTVLAKSELSFNVTKLRGISVDDEFIIFAMLEVPGNETVVNQVWQDGPMSEDGRVMAHAMSGPNMGSMASLNLLSGVSEGVIEGVGGASRLKNIHAILNTISWGILMPIGVITARYVKVIPSSAWFYLHVGCQLSSYLLGVTGWAIGLKLGSSSGVVHSLHRNIGITLFTLATLQILALFIRPKPDHKYRMYWNVYHHLIGYTIIILSIVNILGGFKILGSMGLWKYSYIGVIIVLAGIVVILEVITWIIVCRRKKSEFN